MRRGEGGWTYADGAIWLNASDQSDPRANRRVYVLDRAASVPEGAIWFLGLIAALLLLHAAPGANPIERLSEARL